MSRCIDDHPEVLCLCETEVNRTLFPDYLLELHVLRMAQHGLSCEQTISLLNKKPQNSLDSLFRWYSQASNLITKSYSAENTSMLGDKSPDFYRHSTIVEQFHRDHRLIYTIRDPRAILASILSTKNSSAQEQQGRWRALIENFEVWEAKLESENIHTVRYEDLICKPVETMNGVYQHLGLSTSERFLEPFQRICPRRFLWETAIDWKTGIRKDFDPSRIDRWKTTLDREFMSTVERDPVASRILKKFKYD